MIGPEEKWEDVCIWKEEKRMEADDEMPIDYYEDEKYDSYRDSIG